MARWIVAVSLAVLGCVACNPEQTNNSAANDSADPTVNQGSSQPAEATGNTVEKVSLPDDRTPLEEPTGPIDPKSSEAAGQVVQHYGALIEQGRWTESWKLWSDADSAKMFDRNWRDASEVHMEIGKPAGVEGAAGSSYVTVPVVFYGKKDAGGDFREKAEVTLRRVNDVPGSTEAQRRWHIERVTVFRI